MTDPSTHQARRAASLVDLKPCPFCGGEAFINEGALYSWGLCKRCGAESTAGSSLEKAAKAWNTRASLAGIKQQEEAVSDKPIPERWQPTYSSALKADHKWAFVVKTMAEELGAAEAALSEARNEINLRVEQGKALNQDLEIFRQQLSEARKTIGEQKYLMELASGHRDNLEQQLSEAQQERDGWMSRFAAYESLVGEYKQQVTQQAATLSEMLQERDKTFAENEKLSYQKIDDDAQITRLNFVYEEDQKTLTQQAATIATLEARIAEQDRLIRLSAEYGMLPK